MPILNRQAFRWQRLCLVPLDGDDMFVAFKVKPSWRPPVVHEHQGRRFFRTDQFTAGAPREFTGWRADLPDLDPYPIYREAST